MECVYGYAFVCAAFQAGFYVCEQVENSNPSYLRAHREVEYIKAATAVQGTQLLYHHLPSLYHLVR